MNKAQSIQNLMNHVGDRDIVIASTGHVSRIIFTNHDRPLNFYVCGAMGSSLAIGMGLAMNLPDRTVFVFEGDAGALMGLNNIVLLNYLKLPKLQYFVLDDNACSSTGGQKTCSELLYIPPAVIFKVDKSTDEGLSRIEDPIKLKERFMNALKE